MPADWHIHLKDQQQDPVRGCPTQRPGRDERFLGAGYELSQMGFKPGPHRVAAIMNEG